MRFCFSALAAMAILGCGRSEPPVAGGKPVSHWLEALKDPDAKVRKTAAVKLGNIGTADPQALPALIDALKDQDAAVRSQAIMSLLKYGPGQVEIVPALEEAARIDGDAQVREHATKALASLKAMK